MLKLGAPAPGTKDSRKIGASPITMVPLMVVAVMIAGPTPSPR